MCVFGTVLLFVIITALYADASSGFRLGGRFKLREEKMIIDIHSHMGDPWYAYWKKNVDVEDHLASMERYGIDKRCVSWWQPHNAPDQGNVEIAQVI